MIAFGIVFLISVFFGTILVRMEIQVRMDLFCGREGIYVDTARYIISAISVTAIFASLIFPLPFNPPFIATVLIGILDLVVTLYVIYVYFKEKKDLLARCGKDNERMRERDIAFILALPMSKLEEKWEEAANKSTPDSISEEQFIQRYLYTDTEKKILDSLPTEK